jgi:phosphate uptake regulator
MYFKEYVESYLNESLESEKAKAQEMLRKVNDALAASSHSFDDVKRSKLMNRRSSLYKKIETLNSKILKRAD